MWPPKKRKAVLDDPDVKIQVAQKNPKRPGSASYSRYEAYKKATTIGEYLDCGGSKADLRHDAEKDFLQLLDVSRPEPRSDAEDDDSEDEEVVRRPTKKAISRPRLAKERRSYAEDDDESSDEESDEGSSEEDSEEDSDEEEEVPTTTKKKRLSFGESLLVLEDSSTEIKIVQKNPKRPGSASYTRYEAYKKATTVAEYLDAGGSRADLRHDADKDYLHVVGHAKEEKEDEEEEEVGDDLALATAEVAHMLLFFMCQLRWQFGMIVEPRRTGSSEPTYELFDAELRRLNFEVDDITRCGRMMDVFFDGPAKGDRWVPWHCAVCEQELFLMEEIRTREGLSEEQRFAAGTAFSASRWVPMWREAVLPNILQPDVDVARRPDQAFGKGSRVFNAMVQWRKEGHKLHTPSFNCYPPRGAKGDLFTAFIAQRHADFAALGVRAFAVIDGEDSVSMADLDAVFRAQPRVGPTMSKVLLVTPHLWYPDLGILNDQCEVGDGANAAFDFLFAKRDSSSRQKKLGGLFDFLHQNIDRLEPRFRPMLKFLAIKTRSAFPCIPPASLAEDLTIYDVQVQLCEWRKFRKNVDKRRSITKHLSSNKNKVSTNKPVVSHDAASSSSSSAASSAV